MNGNDLTIILVISSVMVHSTHGFECYECDSFNDISCTENVRIRDCSLDRDNKSPPPRCLTITFETAGDKEHTLKSCGLSTTAVDDCSIISAKLGINKTTLGSAPQCKLCDTERCNSAVNIHYTHILGIIMACVVFLI